MLSRLILPISILFLLSSSLAAQNYETYKETINNNWEFTKNLNGFSKSERVNLPHSYNAHDALSETDYFRGQVKYKKSLFIPDFTEGKRVYLQFEAALQDADIFVNEQYIGNHQGGYTSFTIDITEQVKTATVKNQVNIEVLLDNSHTYKIPPIQGDFNHWGGIYRDVYLIIKNQIHFDYSDYGSKGIYLKTPNVTNKSAELVIAARVINHFTKAQTIKIQHQVVDAGGEVVKEVEDKLVLQAGEAKEVSQSATINNPTLWSLENPYLYQVKSFLTYNQTVIDEQTTPLGLRYFEINDKNQFLLNGKPFKLIGVSRHQDFEGLGNALSDDIHRYDMELVKEMGANFVRLAHYPQDKAVLEACDRLGLLVWEEIPVVDVGSTDPEFNENAKTMLLELIKQKYNHPSIIIWGTSNEILSGTLRQKRYMHKQDELVKSELKLLNELEQIANETDSQRLTTSAFHGVDDYNRLGFGEIPQLVSWNLYQGWYTEAFNDFGDFIDDQHQRFPDRPLIISEYGAGSDLRINTPNPETFDFSIQYQQELHESYLEQIMERDFIMGALVWNLIDFGAAHRNESMQHINNKGLLTHSRDKKDIYFLYKAFLRKDIPVLRIASRDWSNRLGYSGKTNEVVQPVKVYTNLEEVELLVNNRSLGIKKTAANKVIFDVPFIPGENTIEARSGQNTDMFKIQFQPVPFETKSSFNPFNEIAINCGSNAFFEDEKSRVIWGPDKAYEKGSWGYVGGEIYRNNPNRIGHQTSIGQTYNDPLYQTMRMGMDAYKFDVPDGVYEVELHYAVIGHNEQAVLYDMNEAKEEKTKEPTTFTRVNEKEILFSDTEKTKQYNSAIVKKIRVETFEYKGISISFTEGIEEYSIISGIKIRRLF